MARVITYKELLRLLSQKVDEPASEGTAGQRLTTDGHGGRAWTGSGSIIAADRVRIDGNEYFVRTGEAGAAGFLTIGENTLWLGATPFLLDLGGSGVKQIYKDTSVIYTKPAGPSVLFDNGWVEGISWSGNLLTRPQYTSQGHYDFSLVESSGYMKLYIGARDTYSAVYHNCHVCTTEFVSIPSNATKMKVQIYSETTYTRAPQLKFGLLPAVYTNATDDTAGGKLSEWITVTRGNLVTYELTLPSGYAGSDIYRAVVNERQLVKDIGQITMLIYKVWFE